MSKLLDDLIQQSRADTAAYEEFLRKAEELVRRLVARQPEQGVPAVLYGKRQATVIYNNLPQILAAGAAGVDGAAGEPGSEGEEARAQLALQIDQEAREAQVLNALFPLLNRDRDATRALFELIKNQPGY